MFIDGVDYIKKTMSLNLDLVVGFILGGLRDINNSVLPPLLVHLCWLFLNVIDDKWSASLLHNSININGTVIQRINRRGYKSAFLENVVSCGIHVWTFRVTGGSFVELGIQSTNLSVDKTIDFGLSYESITRKTYWQRFFPVSRFGSRYRVKRGLFLIEMKLNFNKMTLSFCVNDIFRCALNVHSAQYRAVVTLKDFYTEVELLSYHVCFYSGKKC